MPSTDPRYLDVTLDEVLADYYAHMYFDDPKAADTVEDDDFDPDDVAAIIGQLNSQDDWEDLT